MEPKPLSQKQTDKIFYDTAKKLKHEHIKYSLPATVGNSTKRSTAEKVLRGLTAPVTLPLMIVGTLGIGIGAAGSVGILMGGGLIGGTIGAAVGRSRASQVKGTKIGIATAGIVASPVILLSAVVGLIGVGLFLGGSSILVPDRTNKMIEALKNKKSQQES
jgi:hypothetical protein